MNRRGFLSNLMATGLFAVHLKFGSLIPMQESVAAVPPSFSFILKHKPSKSVTPFFNLDAAPSIIPNDQLEKEVSYVLQSSLSVFKKEQQLEKGKDFNYDEEAGIVTLNMTESEAEDVDVYYQAHTPEQRMPTWWVEKTKDAWTKRPKKVDKLVALQDAGFSGCTVL